MIKGVIRYGDCGEIMQRWIASGIKVSMCVTSPPYFGLRDYGIEGQIGLEETPQIYVERMVEVFRCVKRLLADDGTLWLNLGDSYAGSWGAQSRPNGNDIKSTIGGGSMLSARQIAAHPKTTLTGSLKNTPGLKPKDLIGIPWRVAFALQEDGWYLRQDIIWSKPNPMPESVRDRCTKAHEYIFMLSKSSRYYYDTDAIKEPSSEISLARAGRADLRNKEGWADAFHGNPPTGLKRDKQRGHSRRHAGFNDRWDAMEKSEQCSGMRNKRSVWNIAPSPFKGAHFATFPVKLIQPCILAGAPLNGIVLDPFMGSGTTAEVAQSLGRRYLGCELNPAYESLINERLSKFEVAAD